MPQVKLTLKTDEGLARPEQMRQTMQQLIDAGLLPASGMVLTFTVETEDDANLLEDTLTAALELRHWCIEAEIEIKTKRGIARKVQQIATPMDRALASMA